MPRSKKDAKILNIKLAATVYEQLEHFCSESGLSKTMATEKILAQFFDNYFHKPAMERLIFKTISDEGTRND
jgi:hypothetical protein